jgi:Formyl transferase
MCSACPRTRLPFDFRQLPRARICAGSCDFRMPFHELRCLFRNTATVYTISCCGPPPENSEGKSTPVLSNYPDLESVVKPFGIPFHQFLDEGEQNQAGKKPIGTAGGQSDRSRVLARYLQVLSGEFLSPCPNRIINIHGWFLTAFVGARPCHRARYGAHQPPRYCRGFDSQGRDLEKIVHARAARFHWNRVFFPTAGKRVCLTGLEPIANGALPSATKIVNT